MVDRTIDVVLATATWVALYVDQENGAPDFWDALLQTSDHRALVLRGMSMSKPLVLDVDGARALIQYARHLPGWADEDAPEFAPHPILVQDASE